MPFRSYPKTSDHIASVAWRWPRADRKWILQKPQCRESRLKAIMLVARRFEGELAVWRRKEDIGRGKQIPWIAISETFPPRS